MVALLVSLCSATSPPFPSVIPLDCNETQAQTEVAINLINEDRDEGFVFKPVRVRSVFQQNVSNYHIVMTKCNCISYHIHLYGHKNTCLKEGRKFDFFYEYDKI